MTGNQQSSNLFGLAPSLKTAYNQPENQGISDATIGKAAFNFGLSLQIGAGIIDGIAAYHGVQAQQSDYRTKSLNADSRNVMAQYGASQARIVAGQIMQAGDQARRQLGQQAGQAQAANRTRQAVRGVTNAGSAAEVQASMRYKQQAEELTLDTNTLRQKQAADRRRLDMINRAGQERVAAKNYLDMASALSPGLAAATSVVQGLGAVAGTVSNYYGGKP